MKVLYLTSHGGKNGGGLFTTMTSIMPQLVNLGVEVGLMCFDNDDLRDAGNNYDGIGVYPYRVSKIPFLSQLGYSSELYSKIQEFNPDIIHVQGLWLYYSYVAHHYATANTDCKVIVQPHGMLDEWAVRNSGWKKRMVGALFENNCLNTAACIHALCLAELNSIRHYGVKTPIAVIPNGITLDVPLMSRNSKSVKTLLYIGRIHPKKGLKEFIDALGMLKIQDSKFFSQWQIKIAGWDQNNFQEELMASVSQLELADKVSFLGPIFGEEKKCELMNADAFILPSHSEGLPMTVLEAWAYSLPVLMTDSCNLPEGFKESAAIRIIPVSDGICEGLLSLNRLSSDRLNEIGRNGYNLVKNKFQWEEIAHKTIELYNYVLGRELKPNFVYENSSEGLQ